MASMAWFVGLVTLASTTASDQNTDAAFWVAVFGDAASLFLFAAPLWTFWRIRKDGSVGDVLPFTYVAALFNCTVWLLYACLALENSMLVIIINSIGLLAYVGYVWIYFCYLNDEDMRHTLVSTLVVGALFICAVVAIGLGLSYDAFAYVAAASSMAMYASPLPTTWTACCSDSLEDVDLDPIMALAMLVNAIIWFSYSFIVTNYFIMVPNLVGLVSAGAHLGAYVKLKAQEHHGGLPLLS